MEVRWHRNCLENWDKTNQGKERMLQREAKALAEAKKRADFYRHQIAEAEKEGRVFFDRERYRVTRNNPVEARPQMPEGLPAHEIIGSVIITRNQ